MKRFAIIWFAATTTALIFGYGMFQPHSAMAQTAIHDGGICKLTNKPPRSVKSYRIVPKTTAPSRHLKPGEKYVIGYEIFSSCYARCADVAELDLPVVAKLGKDLYFDYSVRTEARGAKSKILQKAKVYRQTCGDPIYRAVEYTVPYPGEVEHNFDRTNTWMTIGLCPPAFNFECATHTIFVDNIDKSGWRVRVEDLLTTGGSGPNKVTVHANIRVTNQTGRQIYPGNKKRLQLWRVARVGQPTNLEIADKPLPTILKSGYARIEFDDVVTGEGVRYYYACLVGPDSNGWPTPTVCSPTKVVDVSLSDGQKFDVGPVGANWGGQITATAPVETSFRASFPVTNKYSTHVAAGKFFNVWQRKIGGGEPDKRIVTGELGALRGSASLIKAFRIGKLSAGRYEFIACITRQREGYIATAHCGPWSSIAVGTPVVQPAPPPVAPVANTCTGGRSKDAQGRCVCPAGSSWNPSRGFQRCYTCEGGRDWNVSQKRCVCPSGTTWNKRSNKCATVTQACTGGRVYDRSQSKCICEGDLFWNPGLKRCYACTGGRNWNARSNRCICPSGTKWSSRAKKCAAVTKACTGGRSKNAQGRCVCPAGSSWNPNRGFQRCYTCTGGRNWNVSQRRCVCPSGTKWNSRGKKCAAVGKQVPRAVQPKAPRAVQPKKSSAKLQCIGGEVRGALCWCGFGKFPKKIGRNVYRCR